jgi:hypothetical protein
MSNDLSIHVADANDHRSIVRLAEGDAHAPLRYLDLFKHPIAQQELADRVARHLEEPGAHLVAVEGGSTVGAVTVRPIPDLVTMFDVPVHEVVAVLTAEGHGPDRTRIGRRLLEAGLEAVAPEGAGLVLLRLEADDAEALLAAEGAGFRIRESTITFVNDLDRRDRNPPPPEQDIRLHRFSEDGPLTEELRSHLRSQQFQLVDDHYHADPRLPDERCDALYARVFDRALAGEGADALVMRFVDDEIASMGTWKHWSNLEAYGVSMAGSSFGFRADTAPPGNIGVTSFACNETITGNRLLEWSTQATNFAIVNMVIRLPSMRHVRTSYMLHAWTDGAWL